MPPATAFIHAAFYYAIAIMLADESEAFALPPLLRHHAIFADYAATSLPPAMPPPLLYDDYADADADCCHAAFTLRH